MIDLHTGILSEKDEMYTGRMTFGLSHICNYLYVVGGADREHKTIHTCEKYNILTDCWDKMPSLLPDLFVFAMTTLAIKKRFIYGFGGQN
jgi:hypothetical protein